MLAVAATARKTQDDLLLMKEMNERNIEKNEVTYVTVFVIVFSRQLVARVLCASDNQPCVSSLPLLNPVVPSTFPCRFSSAITACEKSGDWRTAVDLLDTMEKEGLTRTAISYNAAISACEKGMVPQKACEVFQRMKRE